jgi:hypothetical protein
MRCFVINDEIQHSLTLPSISFRGINVKVVNEQAVSCRYFARISFSKISSLQLMLTCPLTKNILKLYTGFLVSPSYFALTFR